eukprot:14021731-Alexandrium_andersonii.AAC.1
MPGATDAEATSSSCDSPGSYHSNSGDGSKMTGMLTHEVTRVVHSNPCRNPASPCRRCGQQGL